MDIKKNNWDKLDQQQKFLSDPSGYKMDSEMYDLGSTFVPLNMTP